jgi:hypothetical protein
MPNLSSKLLVLANAIGAIPSLSKSGIFERRWGGVASPSAHSMDKGLNSKEPVLGALQAHLQ